MTDITTVVACTDCGVYWTRGADEPNCANGAHHHERHELHRHRATVALPDGTEVVAVSFDPADPYTRTPDRQPGFGLYLDSRWEPPWPYGRVDWPDFGIPTDASVLVEALQDVLRRARAGERIEIGCVGGHGRTGTALACLAVLAGHPRDNAVDWVRANYCPKAVETAEQAAFVTTLPFSPP